MSEDNKKHLEAMKKYEDCLSRYIGELALLGIPLICLLLFIL